MQEPFANAKDLRKWVIVKRCPAHLQAAGARQRRRTQRLDRLMTQLGVLNVQVPGEGYAVEGQCDDVYQKVRVGLELLSTGH